MSKRYLRNRQNRYKKLGDRYDNILSLILMFAVKYRPKQLNQFRLRYDFRDIKNYIFNGPRGCGKKTLAYCLLANVFGDGVYQMKVNTFELENKTEFSYRISNYHIEIAIGRYGSKDRNIICEFIRDIASTPNLITNSQKIFVIIGADELSDKAQGAFRMIIEKTIYTARFIFLCNNLSKLIEPLRSRFLVIRIPAPTIAETTIILKDIAKGEKIRTNKNLIANVIAEGSKLYGHINLKDVINIFQISYVSGKYSKYQCHILENLDKLVEFIQTHNNDITRLREIIYKIYIDNISITTVIKYVAKHIIEKCGNGNEHENEKVRIIQLASYYQTLTCTGNKQPLYLEKFILDLVGEAFSEKA